MGFCFISPNASEFSSFPGMTLLNLLRNNYMAKISPFSLLGGW